MWFKRPPKNRRLGRNHVLDVKLRSDQVRAVYFRTTAMVGALVFGTLFGIYLFWRSGEFVLDKFVYENSDYSIQNIEVRSDGVIAPEQLRRWSGVKLGSNLIGLDLTLVKRNLEMISAVDSVSVERILPHTLKIRVVEREAIAQINVPHADAAGNITVSVYHLDAQGIVMQPLDPRVSTVSIGQVSDQLPVITGLNVYEIQPAHRVELPQVQAALQLIQSFDRSPMVGLVDLQRLDVSAPGVVVVNTAQGSEITFGLDNPDWQLRRWREIYDWGLRQGKTIASADLAVANNVPVHLLAATTSPDTVPKSAKPLKARRRNV
jgi:hypothetical protein